MALTFTNQTGNATGVDATSFSQSFSATASELYIACINAERTTTQPPDPTVTHNSITATKIASLYWDSVSSDKRMLWVYAWDSGAGSASVSMTIDFGVTMTGAEWRVFHISGSDMANGLAQTFVQVPNTGAGLSGTSGSVGLAAAGDAGNRPFAVFSHAANEEHNVQASWTTLTNVGHANPTNAMKPQYRSDAFETTASMTWTTSATYGGIAAEVKVAGAGGGTTTVDPFGMAGFYGA